MPDIRLLLGDCREVLLGLPEASADAIVTDPPYELGFMGKAWDGTGVAFDPATWRAVLRSLKPGGYLAAFGGTRTYHRMAVAIEDAGFEIRDCIMWLYGTGFPKGQGCLKPAYEPIVLARKPGPKVLPLGIDECRVPTDENPSGSRRKYANSSESGVTDPDRWVDRRTRETFQADRPAESLGRYPANVVHDGSDEVMEAFAAFGEKTSNPGQYKATAAQGMYGPRRQVGTITSVGDSGSAARFFYCAKASKAERGDANSHPTVKPLALMEWLVKLACPAGGTVVDPFVGSGTTGVACGGIDRGFIGIDNDPGHIAIADRRIAASRPLAPLFV